MNKICANCRYSCFGAYKEATKYEAEKESWHCRRYAPRIIAGVGTGSSHDIFPLIRENDWCGEWKEKEG